MPIRAVIFDFGGVLMRTEDHTGRIKWEQRLGLPRFGLEKIVFGSDIANQGMLGKTPMEASWQYIAEVFQLNPEELARLQHDFFAGDCLDTALVEFLGGLRPRYRTALLSNAWSNARELFSQLGLDKVVDVMVISAEEGLAKPDPRIYHTVLERLGVLPQEAIFVDDFIENIEGARSLGMHVVHFCDAAQALAAVERLLDKHRRADGGEQ